MSDASNPYNLSPEQLMAYHKYKEDWAKLSSEEQRKRSRTAMSEPVAIGMAHTTVALQDGGDAASISTAIHNDKKERVEQVAKQVQVIFSELLQRESYASYQNIGALWVPSREDFHRVFVRDADDAYESYQRLFASTPVAAPKSGQTYVRIEASAAEDILVASMFPGGFSKIINNIRKDTVWVCWKFTEPHKKTGMAYNGLVSFDGQLKWFPKPWRYWGV
jgi:hypothetical protein